MILKKEINDKSVKWGIPADIVDKDWVLGHFLAAFYSIDEHKDKLLFKGGTALRKCYFPNYRFSEDLDFTSNTNNYKLTFSRLKNIINLIENTSGILFYIDNVSELKYQDKLMGYQAKLKYWGANHSKNQQPPAPEKWTTSIKIEITLFEKIIFKPELKKIIHPYSDKLLYNTGQIPCYSLKEIFSEKIRALVQRSYSAPRDYYDIYELKRFFDENDWIEMKLHGLKSVVSFGSA